MIVFLHAVLSYLSALLVSGRIEVTGAAGRFRIAALSSSAVSIDKRREITSTSRRENRSSLSDR
jgi:hypothetical protein